MYRVVHFVQQSAGIKTAQMLTVTYTQIYKYCRCFIAIVPLYGILCRAGSCIKACWYFCWAFVLLPEENQRKTKKLLFYIFHVFCAPKGLVFISSRWSFHLNLFSLLLENRLISHSKIYLFTNPYEIGWSLLKKSANL